MIHRVVKMLNNDNHLNLASEYFDYLAQLFPVMCASDEFDFLPRCQAASNYYHRLDKLDARTIEESIANLKNYQNNFADLAKHETDFENSIDLQLLQANIAGILIEFESKQTWQHNPLMYLKIAFIGFDHALTKPATDPGEQVGRSLSRLAAIPELLKNATNNIVSVPTSYHQASRLMLSDCQKYLDLRGSRLLQILTGKKADMLSAYMSDALAALKAFDGYLATMSPKPDRLYAIETLQPTLRNHFLSLRGVDEIYQIALEDWEENLKQLELLKSKIEPRMTWQELYHAYVPSDIDNNNIIALYAQEVKRLQQFFSHQGFGSADLEKPVEIAETPIYLRSVRGAASFAAAFTADESEISYFYITTQLPSHRTNQADMLLKKRLHREFKMLAAHETIPGHHFLDSVRRRLANPVRRQIESPLFYEGWASYAESLLIDSGYLSRPIELLIDYKRRLWRSARCQVDVGLTTDKIKVEKAIQLLKVCGFSIEEAQRQIDRFRLNPGYQLCYSLGCHEFKELKTSYGRDMDVTQFHNFLLEGGELPFHLIKKRLNALKQYGGHLAD